MEQNKDSYDIIKNATLSFQQSKRYIRKRDMKLFLRCMQLNKNDMDFLEQCVLIHLKNIQLHSKIPQNFQVTLSNYIFNSLFTRNFFTSIEMLRIVCYYFSIFSHNMLLKDVKYHLRYFLYENLAKIKSFSSASNAIYFLQPLPNMQQEIESFLQDSIAILTHKNIESLIINPLQLILNPQHQDSESFIKAFSANLVELLDNSNAKTIILDNTYHFFDEILESITLCLKNIPYPVSVAVSIPSYTLDSNIMLEKLIKVSSKIYAEKKTKLIVRFTDLDIHYEYESFISSYNHKMNTTFSNPSSAMNNFIALLQQYVAHKDVLDCHIVSQDLLLLHFLQTLDCKVTLEVQPQLNYPFYRIAKKMGLRLIATNFYTTHFTEVLAFSLKSALNTLNKGLFHTITMHNNKQEWERKSNSFEHILTDLQKGIKKEVLKDSNSLFHVQSYNFETFDYELQKPLYTQDSLSQKDTMSEESFANILDTLQFKTPNVKKIEDILYLNAADMHRLSMQGLSNIPTTFSLHADDEKEAFNRALKKKEEIFANRISIITFSIVQLKESARKICATLCELYPNIPHSIFEEQIYILIDTFKYYAYEYRKLLQETDSVLLMPLGTIFVHTKKLTIHEIASIIAINIMIGNVTCLDDSVLSRVLYHVFSPIFDFCHFMYLADFTSMPQDSMGKEIIAKNDLSKYPTQNNLLVWDKGVSIIFISSFYNFYDAYLEIQNMRFFGNSTIIIYTDEYIYDKAKQVFIPLQVLQSSLGNLINNLPSDVSNVSLFTYNKAEMNYAINHLKVSLAINATYKSKLVSGSPRTFLSGYLQPFGSRLLLTQLLQTSPNNVIKNNSLYSDIIGCFGSLLSVDEIDFLYNLNHNYSQFLKNLERIANFDNIYEVKKPYAMILRVYENDDFFHVCVIMLIAFLLQITTKISFIPNYFDKKEHFFTRLQAELQEKYIHIFTLAFEQEEEFIAELQPQTLVRILQDEEEYMQTSSYKQIRKASIIAEYSLPILNKNLELERYLATQYIQIQPNFFLQTSVNN